MTQVSAGWRWIRENGAALLIVTGVLGGVWVTATNVATDEEVDRITATLATKADVANLVTRDDLAESVAPLDFLNRRDLYS